MYIGERDNARKDKTKHRAMNDAASALLFHNSFRPFRARLRRRNQRPQPSLLPRVVEREDDGEPLRPAPPGLAHGPPPVVERERGAAAAAAVAVSTITAGRRGRRRTLLLDRRGEGRPEEEVLDLK